MKRRRLSTGKERLKLEAIRNLGLHYHATGWGVTGGIFHHSLEKSLTKISKTTKVGRGNGDKFLSLHRKTKKKHPENRKRDWGTN